MSNLPGIGKRTALRLILHMLGRPASQTEKLSEALKNLVNEIEYCKKCHTISDHDLCQICSNPIRDHSIICVVEDIRDVMRSEERRVGKECRTQSMTEHIKEKRQIK